MPLTSPHPLPFQKFTNILKYSGALKQAIETNVRVLKYKVIFYTYDHRLSEVKRWMKKGFSAWNNPMINAHLRKHGCQTLQFVETLVGIIINTTLYPFSFQKDSHLVH